MSDISSTSSPRRCLLQLIVQLWKHTNPVSLNTPSFNEIIISPSTQEYLSVDDAIKIVNEEMPPGYRLRKACQIRFQVADDKPVNDTGERRSVFLKGTSLVKLSFDVAEEFCYRYR